MTIETGPVLADLAGTWDLTDAEGEHACAIALPGDVISGLQAAGRIPDPYWGRNEYGLRWIAERDWTVRRRVHLRQAEAVIELEGLDCLCTVAVNGQTVLQTANAFRSYRADLTGIAVAGENEVAITFHATPRAAGALQAAQPFFIPYHAGNSPIPHGNMLRKVQCDFGWDWNIALAPMGIYGTMRILPAAAPRIASVHVAQAHARGQVTLTVTAQVTAAPGTPCTISFGGQSLEVAIEDESEAVTAVFEIENPALWWPAGLGEQTLHELTVTLGELRQTRRIGLRELTLVTEADDAGLGFKFRCNGVDVFARGANWIPADALAGRITEAATRDLLQSAVDANMNMIRVWGGGRYEPDSFYDACDELGLMVWQDFMFACHLYPSTALFLSEVEAEVRENVARLQHHACLALWCGDNELIGALTWFPESRENRDRYLVNYDRLNRLIEAALKDTDPGANWWPSSPSPGPMNFGDAWHADGSGDMHFWSVWHEGRDFDHYRDVSPRFCSEFGFQSYPSMDVIAKFAEPKDWNIASPVFESHQKNKGGNARIAETMFRYFRWPERFADFVWLSQIQQGLAIKTAVSHWRSLKPHCMGTLYWQLNDTWPVCSWSSLDHGGSWKMLHHMARHFYQPVQVMAIPVEDEIELTAVNDGLSPVPLRLSAFAQALDGSARPLGDGMQVVAPDLAVSVLTIKTSALREDEVLRWNWSTSDGRDGMDIFAPRPWKTYELRDPGLQAEVTRTEDGAWALALSASALAVFVTVEADRPGRFSDNAVTLVPGSEARLTFLPADPEGPDPEFRLRDLWSATMA